MKVGFILTTIIVCALNAACSHAKVVSSNNSNYQNTAHSNISTNSRIKEDEDVVNNEVSIDAQDWYENGTVALGISGRKWPWATHDAQWFVKNCEVLGNGIPQPDFVIKIAQTVKGLRGIQIWGEYVVLYFTPTMTPEAKTSLENTLGLLQDDGQVKIHWRPCTNTTCPNLD
jgi:hypothetical protein